jgi:hypothetical protein
MEKSVITASVGATYLDGRSRPSNATVEYGIVFSLDVRDVGALFSIAAA